MSDGNVLLLIFWFVYAAFLASAVWMARSANAQRIKREDVAHMNDKHPGWG